MPSGLAKKAKSAGGGIASVAPKNLAKKGLAKAKKIGKAVVKKMKKFVDKHGLRKYWDRLKMLIKLGKKLLKCIKLPSTLPCLFTVLVSCLLYTSPSPRDRTRSRMPSSA
eukprot:TRINITY_DN830_c0_g1_i1.p2 TRINITY_DN830_c0_g1~~TRINITY_DN830_c0_g1_i1.p2  ORF type:complete len:110 (+),score=50.14 TRINITY_DN830_c0_g1_i1:98-427(+)